LAYKRYHWHAAIVRIAKGPKTGRRISRLNPVSEMAPNLVKEFIQALHEEVSRRRSDDVSQRRALERKLPAVRPAMIGDDPL